jgi:hypothetical protein
VILHSVDGVCEMTITDQHVPRLKITAACYTIRYISRITEMLPYCLLHVVKKQIQITCAAAVTIVRAV